MSLHICQHTCTIARAIVMVTLSLTSTALATAAIDDVLTDSGC